jgi:hypothetical protein
MRSNFLNQTFASVNMEYLRYKRSALIGIGVTLLGVLLLFSENVLFAAGAISLGAIIILAAVVGAMWNA